MRLRLATAATGCGLLGRSLLGRSPLGCGLAGRSLLHNLLDGCLAGRSLLHNLLDGCLFGRSLLHNLFRGCLLGGRFLSRLLGPTACDNATFHCWSFRRKPLRARNNRFELCAGPEGRHGGWLHLYGLAGAGVTGYAGRAAPLLENTEPSNGDTLALVYCAHNRVDDILDGRGCVPTV